MKWTPDIFHSDRLELSWLDLFRLALGMELRISALRIRRENTEPVIDVIRETQEIWKEIRDHSRSAH